MEPVYCAVRWPDSWRREVNVAILDLFGDKAEEVAEDINAAEERL